MAILPYDNRWCQVSARRELETIPGQDIIRRWTARPLSRGVRHFRVWPRLSRRSCLFPFPDQGGGWERRGPRGGGVIPPRESSGLVRRYFVSGGSGSKCPHFLSIFSVISLMVSVRASPKESGGWAKPPVISPYVFAGKRRDLPRPPYNSRTIRRRNRASAGFSTSNARTDGRTIQPCPDHSAVKSTPEFQVQMLSESADPRIRQDG